MLQIIPFLIPKKNPISLFIFIMISTTYLLKVHSEPHNQIFKFRRTINVERDLKGGIAVSPFGYQVVVGTLDGLIQIFDYKSGKFQAQFNQNNMEIRAIIWEPDRNGFITVSVSQTSNQSLAIIRERNSFDEIYRWQFNSTVKNVDVVFTEWESYVGFNFGNRIEEYDIKLKERSSVYRNFRGKQFLQMSYSSDYSYLYALGFDPKQNLYEVYHLVCNRNYGWYYYTDAKVSNIVADKYDFVNNLMIFKSVQQNRTEFLVQAYERVYDYKFPQKRSFKYFKYCQSEYMLGITSGNEIVFYSKDFNFTQLAVIDMPSIMGNADILEMECKKGHMIISTSQNKLHVFQLTPFQAEQSVDWLKIGIISGLVIVVIGVIGVMILKKIKREKRKKKQLLKENLVQN